MSTLIRITLALVTVMAGFLAVVERASAQLIIPIDQRLPPPQGFDFKGRWNCGDGISTAYLSVGSYDQPDKNSEPLPMGHWTHVRESQEGFYGKYFVAYNMNNSQFLLVDEDDPISLSYRTKGWQGNKLLLTALTDKNQLPHHVIFAVTGPRSFTVTWELLEGTAWKKDPSFTCERVATGKEDARR